MYNAAALQNKKVLSSIRDALIILHDSIYLNIILTQAKMKTIRKSSCSCTIRP